MPRKNSGALHWVINKSAYMAIAVDVEGIKHILGLWIAKEQGASFWAQVSSNLPNRGVKNVLIVCCDGLKGLPDAVAWFHGANLWRAPDSCRQPVGSLRGPEESVSGVEENLHRPR